MGARLSAGDKVQPREFNSLKKSESDASERYKTKNRSTTDVCFLLFLTTFLIILLFFLGYCVFNGDILRIINGYDNCGNICGRRKTILQDDTRGKECTASPPISEPYHIIFRNNATGAKVRTCVSDCQKYEGYRKFFHRCIPVASHKVVNTFFSKTGIKNFFQEVSEDFYLVWPETIYLGFVAFGFSIIIFILFRFMVKVVVWVVLIGVVASCSAGAVTLWILWVQAKKAADSFSENQVSDVDYRKRQAYFVFAILATVLTFIVLLVIFIMRKRIQLVVQLFKEAGKSISFMPLILLQPILTFFALVFLIALWIYFCLWIESSGRLVKKAANVYYYEKDVWMKFARWYNFLAMLWMCQFVIGCQHMVIAGAVSEWYFAMNKNLVKTPIFQSFYNLTRYHLGSVALGSFLIAVVQFVRVILKIAEKYLNNHRGKCVKCILKCCQCYLYCFEKILKYLSRNAYIEVAIHGFSFCPASRQAFKILVNNALRVTAINSVGGFVLFLGKVLVVAATVLIGTKMLQNKEGLQHLWVPLTLAGLFAYFIAHCFMTVYEMTIDTIFICFCEDCEENDGVTKPYCMSRELMEFVENSKKAIEVYEIRRQKGQIWQQTAVPTISLSVEGKQ